MIHRTTSTVACALALAGAQATLAGGSVADDEVIRATLVAGQPSVMRFVKMIPEVFEPEMNRRLEGSGYRVDFSEQFGGSIAASGEELEALGSGLAEIGTCISLFEPSKLALQNITFYTPFVTDDIRKVGELMNRLHREDPAMKASFEDNDVVFLGAPIIVDDYVLMTDFPVESMADLKGRKIGVPAAAMSWLAGTGAVGVSGSLATYYNEIKTGVYDGVLVFASSALPAKLHEVAPNITRLALGAQFAGGLCANKDWYECLATPVHDALEGAADATQEWYFGDLEAAASAALDIMAEQGATVRTSSDEMREAWAQGLGNAAQQWATTLDGQGKAGSETLSLYMDSMRQAGATPLREWDKE